MSPAGSTGPPGSPGSPDPFERVPLAGSGLAVTRLGLGTAPLGGLFTPVTGEQAGDTLRAAWEAGIRYFDTAPHYGAGLAEERLGAFLRSRPRAEAVVSTKVGRLLTPGADPERDEGFHGARGRVRVRDYSREGVRRSIADSLERSGLDRVDIAFIHDPDDHWEQAIGEAYPALAALRAEGAVGAIGVGMNQCAMLDRFVAEADLDCVLVAGRYSLLDRSAADALFPRCAARGVAVLVGGVFNSGILADPASPAATYDYAPAPEPLRRRALALARRCADHGVPLAAAALRFPLRHPAVTGVLVGARTRHEVAQNAAHATLAVPEELWQALDEPVPGAA